MNLSTCIYSFSHANSVGNFLEKPLFTLVSNAIISIGAPPNSRVKAVVQIALNCFLALALIAPAAFAWGVRKMISRLSPVQINHEALHLAPLPIQILENVESDEKIDIHEISQRFIQLNLKDSPINRTSQEQSLQKLCRYIIEENPIVYAENTNKRALFYKELSLLLKGILKKIQSGAISENKQREIFQELAKAATVCYPTWLEVATKFYNELHAQQETAEIKILRLVQDYKERILLDFFEKKTESHWNVLNYVRNIAGQELGLQSGVNKYDTHAPERARSFLDAWLAKWILMQRYEHVHELITALETRINMQAYDGSYYSLLLEAVKAQGIEKPEDFVAIQFYTEDYKINHQGIYFLLKIIGIVK